MPPLNISRFHPIFPGATYFITSVAYKRRRWFVNPALARIIVDQLVHYQKEYQFELPAYAILPDHYHAVITVGERKTISQILHAVHSHSATLITNNSEKPQKKESGREEHGTSLQGMMECIGK
jgi:REP element-mobilizing transposase RayT